MSRSRPKTDERKYSYGYDMDEERHHGGVGNALNDVMVTVSLLEDPP
jgi:hypothetical protein